MISARRKVWVNTMMREELRLIEDRKQPLDVAIATFAAFDLSDLILLIPFVY
jgi:vacuolar iron transporter family protein